MHISLVLGATGRARGPRATVAGTDGNYLDGMAAGGWWDVKNSLTDQWYCCSANDPVLPRSSNNGWNRGAKEISSRSNESAGKRMKHPKVTL